MARATLEEGRAIAYEKLGVTPAAALAQVRITDQLLEVHRQLRDLGYGGTYYEMLVEFMAASDSPDAKSILDAYYSVPAYRKFLPIEAYCAAASVSPLRVLECVVSAAVRRGATTSAIIAAVSHPKVVRKTIEQALTDDGVEDRITLHKATGFLPQPKGAQTTIQVNAQANAGAHASAVGAPHPEQTIRRLVDRFNASRGLPAASTEPVPEVMPTSEQPLPIYVHDSAESVQEDE